MSPSLSVVVDHEPAPPKVETLGQHVRRLQAEAKNLARAHLAAFTAAMSDLSLMAAEITDGGDAYPPGARDIARQLAEDLESRAETLEAIMARAR